MSASTSSSSIYDAIKAQNPSSTLLQEKADQIQAYGNQKLYHQLVETVFELLPLLTEKLQNDLVEKEIKPIAGKLNPVRYMELVGILLKAKLSTTNPPKQEKDNLLAWLADHFQPFDILPKRQPEPTSSTTTTTGDKDGKDKTDKDGDKKMEDAAKPTSFAAKKIGQLSHYNKAAEADFLDARALHLSLKASVLVSFNDLEAAKETVADELKDELFKYRVPVSVKPRVFAWFYKSQMLVYHLAQDSSKYYAAGVNYLRYTPLSEVDFPLVDLAVNLGIAALVAPGEYNFGQLLGMDLFQHDLIKNQLWIYDLLYAFQEGKYELYDACQKKWAAEISKASILKEKEAEIYEKFCSTVLMEFAFRQPKGKRTIQLNELRKLIRVEDIETLLINAMCADLIKGTIDQVEQTFSYHYVKPRVLDKTRIHDLESRVTTWIEQQNVVLKQFEELTPELLVTV